MNIFDAENVYETLTGSACGEYKTPGIENAFLEDSLCDQLYQQVYSANRRLCARLGQMDEDADVELIINNLLQINRILCLQMYDYGKTIIGCIE